jgi:hypothetical protein
VSRFSNRRGRGSGIIGLTKEVAMKRVSTLVLLATFCAATAWAEPVGERFHFMAGCWSGSKGTTTFQEQWTRASPDLMLGMSFTTRPSKPTEFEFLRIETKAGVPTYMAQPQGAPPTPFALSEADSTADSAMFVNMAHDFPKRIAYKKVDATTLLAWIDAGPKGSMRIDFPMKRVACPGASEN